MITRIWHGKTDKAQSEQYLDFLLNNGTRGYRETPGNKSVKVWKKEEGNQCHFCTVTVWKDIEAIKRFAGPEYEKAVYYPEDEGVLLEFEELVEHYETYDLSSTRIKGHISKLNQLMDGGAWLDEDFLHKIQNLDEDLAYYTPYPGMNSIAGLVWHCTYWKKVAIHHILGDHTYRDKTIDKMNFLPMAALKSRGWDSLKNEFKITHDELVDRLGSKTDYLLDEEYVPGYIYDYLIEGIIQHDAYHLGQIGLILRIISSRTPY